MGIFETLNLALSGVSSNKFRSFLTLLGIIIGVSSVILMVSLGNGTQKVVSGQFQNLETRQFYLSTNYNLPYQMRGRLALEDVEYLREATQGSDDVVPFYRLYFNIKYGNRNQDNQVAGVVPASKELTNLEIKYGRYIEESDVQNKERVAVIGVRTLRRLVRTTNIQVEGLEEDYTSLIGKDLFIDGKKFIIVGILDESENTIALSDSSVLVPLSTAHEVWRRQTGYIDFFLISYNQSVTEKDIMTQVQYLLDAKYGRTNSGQSKFHLEGLESQVNIMNTIVKVLTYVLGGIAAISLLVGGIGVMNIMLVTVKERTREIGIRRAIGATSVDIQKQFITESILLAVGGGILGIIGGSTLSLLASFVIGKFFDWWQGGIPFWILAVSFGVTVAIGIIFGFYPAYKASRMDPIEALSYN